jgi:hypothetical protein
MRSAVYATACSITAATAGSATAHKVDTDFTEENVKSGTETQHCLRSTTRSPSPGMG